jgi:uncharacterized protein YjiS (DUF1127 family)
MTILSSVEARRASMSVTLYPGTPIPTRRALWQRLADDLRLGWQSLRQARARRRRLRALEGLSEHTLRDIGMAECTGIRSPTVAASNFLRGL